MVSFQTLQLANLVQATALAGFSACLSFISIPTIIESPSPILAIRQWNIQFVRGRAIATPICVSQLLLSVLLVSRTTPEVSGDAYRTLQALYNLSSFLALVIFPFTLYYIQPLNEHLARKAAEQLQLHYADLPEKSAGMQTAKEHEKIYNWGWYNWWRTTAFFLITALNAAAVRLA